MMQRRRVTPGVTPRLLLVCLVLACVVGSTHGAVSNARDLLGPCEPSAQPRCFDSHYMPWERGHLGRFLSRRDACAPRGVHVAYVLVN